MKYLQELVRIVTRKRITKVELLDEEEMRDEKSLYKQFYEGIASGAFKNDNEAAEFFYGATSTDPNYRKLKSRFRKRLMNNLFYLDINDPSFSEYHSAFYTVNKNFALGKILLSSGARNTFLKIAKSTLALSLKYEFHNISVLILRDILAHFILLRDQKTYDKYYELFIDQKKKLDVELEAELAYNYLSLKALKQNLTLEEEKKAESIYKKVQNFKKEFQAYHIFYLCSLAEYFYLHIHKQFNDILILCDEATEYFENHPVIKPEIRMSIFLIIKIETLLNIREFKDIDELVERAQRYFRKGSNNWMIFNEYYFLLSMNTGNYETAMDIYQVVTGNERFGMQPEIRKEKWKLYEAYLHYALETAGYSPEELEQRGLRKFRLMRFLNDVPTFSKDKAGSNTAILIIQIMWLLKQGNYSSIIDKAESLRIYNYRYLKKLDNKRPFTFIKMLLLAEAKSFNRRRTRGLTDKMYESLKERGNTYYSEWEILPYELLWEHIMEKMT